MTNICVKHLRKTSFCVRNSFITHSWHWPSPHQAASVTQPPFRQGHCDPLYRLVPCQPPAALLSCGIQQPHLLRRQQHQKAAPQRQRGREHGGGDRGEVPHQPAGVGQRTHCGERGGPGGEVHPSEQQVWRGGRGSIIHLPERSRRSRSIVQFAGSVSGKLAGEGAGGGRQPRHLQVPQQVQPEGRSHRDRRCLTSSLMRPKPSNLTRTRLSSSDLGRVGRRNPQPPHWPGMEEPELVGDWRLLGDHPRQLQRGGVTPPL